MEGNIYKLKEYVYSNNYKTGFYYIIQDINHFVDTYTVIEVSLNNKETRQMEIPYIELKQLFTLEFDAFLNNFKFNANTLNYRGTYTSEILPWTSMINYTGKCYHIWKKYVGFVEQYEFCEKCNEKKFNND